MKSDPGGKGGPKPDPKPYTPKRGLDVTAGVILGAGFSLVASTLAGYLIGTWVDRSGGSALFAPIGLILGLLAGIHRLFTLFRGVAGGKGSGK